MSKYSKMDSSRGCGCLVMGAVGLVAFAGSPDWMKALVVLAIPMSIYVARRLDAYRGELFRQAVQPHLASLADRRRQLRIVGSYGETLDDKWIRERAYFLRDVIQVPVLREKLLKEERWARILEEEIDDHIAVDGTSLDDPASDFSDNIEAFRNHLRPHLARLTWQRQRLTRTGHYGETLDERWKTEREYFLGKILQLPTEIHERVAAPVLHAIIDEEIDAHIDSLGSLNVSGSDADDGDDGVVPWKALESKCARIAVETGWEASLTVGSGDQGADVIARHGHRVMIVQCKHVSGTVGNRAVQEAISAKVHYRAAIAVVVTNASFTRKALELSESANVHLCHVDEFRELAEALISWPGDEDDPPVGVYRR